MTSARLRRPGAARLVPVLAVVALLLAACSTSGVDSSPTPSTTVGPTPTVQDELVGQPGGSLLLEYLYDVVIAQAACEPAPHRSLGESLTSTELTIAVDDVFDAVDAAAGTCADPAAWTAAMRVLIGALDDLDRLAPQSSSGPPHQYESLPLTDEPVALGPFVTRAVDRLHHTLTEAPPVGASNL